MAADTMMAMEKAASAVPSQSIPKIVNPTVMAPAAPNPAAEEIPNVEGLANALPVMF